MKIPKYWARGTYSDSSSTKGEICAWGWSDISQDDAKSAAVERAKRISQALNDPDRDVKGLRRGQEYEYGAYPLREEVIETLKDDAGNVIAMITRNRYGALVLNTTQVCFVDVDFPEPTSAGLGFFDKIKWFFSSSMYKEASEALAKKTTDSIGAWAKAHPHQSFRLYRTAAGLRLLFTDRLYDPVSPEVNQLFEQLGSDRLYRALTKKQECFRARLTPKPWRCGASSPGNGYQFTADGAAGGVKSEHERWTVAYDKAGEGFAVCELLNSYGQAPADPGISRMLSLHDGYTVKRPGLPLA